jgi:hypothetical protein
VSRLTLDRILYSKLNPTNSGSFLPKTGADANDAKISPGYYTHPRLASRPLSISVTPQMKVNVTSFVYAPRPPPNQEICLCNLLPLAAYPVSLPSFLLFLLFSIILYHTYCSWQTRGLEESQHWCHPAAHRRHRSSWDICT